MGLQVEDVQTWRTLADRARKLRKGGDKRTGLGTLFYEAHGASLIRLWLRDDEMGRYYEIDREGGYGMKRGWVWDPDRPDILYHVYYVG